MEAIIRKSFDLALNDATVLWGLTSTAYPKKHELVINTLAIKMLELVSSFSLNCRRILEQFPPKHKFKMETARWIWESNDSKPVITDLWEATNYIIHAKTLSTGIECLPSHLSFIKGDDNSAFIPYILVKTDHKEFAYIDIFSMVYCFLYDVVGAFNKLLEKH
ncbi:hypothetical protein P7M32_03840 [Bisgaard Taxon 10/6]|uniref:Uncharacterized protein n=1 Tax=Exercitatus varius TaxID=67857 RepID=A0ABT6EQ94_9PAST|nr:hypothetical protein [Exercitatus varius]MDG2940194.1 hypothetical protein [Exercitatus varius]MDG2945560.1 hypothetical protein [Exercitatus varius]